VRLSLHPEIPTQDVATALDIHPFMLSRWKKDWREGRLKASGEVPRLDLPRLPERGEKLSALNKRVRGLERKVEAQTRVRSLERKVRALEVENDLLKKAIRFNFERRKRSSSS
jgi:transposase